MCHQVCSGLLGCDPLRHHSTTVTEVSTCESMSDFEVAIVGAGLVGSLAAISFARQGFRVSLYESRSDPRLGKSSAGRSINLAVSARGLGAIRSIDQDLCDRVLSSSIPMKGRMIHLNGVEQSQIYGLFGECISSVDRTQLNLDLLNEAAGYSNIKLKFDHKLISADFSEHRLMFKHTAGDGTEDTLAAQADLTVGCDGAYSAVRAAMMKAQRMNFSQEYIEHAYLELSILPDSSGEFRLSPEHLHIWPRQEFMLIALPNPDKSFTSTLFAPFSLFDSLKSSQDVIQFFHKQFPDALEMIGENRLTKMWQQNPIAPLIQIKCAPYHFGDSAILLGDATHAMVPFYGQGMNCGFEDVRVLNSILKDSGVCTATVSALGHALQKYSDTRHEDLLAILQLAMGNYVEMRSTVTSRMYLFRKHIDHFLGHLFKDLWVPMYSMVSFRDDIPYSDVIRRQKVQDRIVNSSLIGTCTLFGLAVTSAMWRTSHVQHWRESLTVLAGRAISLLHL